jgi:hypothetical protein
MHMTELNATPERVNNSSQLTLIEDTAAKSAPDLDGKESDFDWSDQESVVLTEQPETAVYWNPRGELVIRQRRWPDDDPCIFISPHNVAAFIDRLTDLCGIPTAGGPVPKRVSHRD